MKIPFVKDAYRGKVPVNWFPAADSDNEVIMYGTPGLVEFCDLTAEVATASTIWAMMPMGAYLYVVAQTSETACTLFQIDSAVNVNNIGSISARGGPVSMVNNGIQIMVTHGANGYVYDTMPKSWTADTPFLQYIYVRPTTSNGYYYQCTVAGTTDSSEPSWPTVVGGTVVDGTVTWTCLAETPIYAQITDPNFIGGVVAAYQDGYGIVVQSDSRNWQASYLHDFTTWDSDSQAAKEGANDNIVAVISDHLNIWLFGERSTEIWYNAGSSPFPFARLSQTFIEKGCAAAASPTKLDNSVFWLSNELQICRSVGYQAKIVSSRKFDRLVSRYDKWDDAIGYAYVIEGHAFYDLHFPTENVTWSYDAATDEMHQKSSYPVGGRHRGNCYALYRNQHILGDYSNGKLYQMDMERFTDAGEPIIATLESSQYFDQGKRIFFPDMQVTFDHGNEALDDSYYDREYDYSAMLSWSSDGARTFPTEIKQELGKQGQYDKRTIFRQLGSGFKRTFRLTVSAPVNRNILSLDWLK